MAFATLHRDDVRTTLAPLPGLAVERELEVQVMASLQQKPAGDMARRMEAGHRAYVARLDGNEAAFGWVATREASIGEVGAAFGIPASERYLWNFVTVPDYRGRGIYPRLLEAILRVESREAERFWIAYAPENHASASGIRKAGFRPVAELSFDAAGRPAVRITESRDGRAASRMLGIRESDAPLTPCWRCVRAGRLNMYCSGDTCACDYQAVEKGCA